LNCTISYNNYSGIGGLFFMNLWPSFSIIRPILTLLDFKNIKKKTNIASRNANKPVVVRAADKE
jgi:hypothetical protein